eukprot:scaffold3900_cov258-Pinguiococcus_pyrenoidosus.AAC.2
MKVRRDTKAIRAEVGSQRLHLKSKLRDPWPIGPLAQWVTHSPLLIGSSQVWLETSKYGMSARPSWSQWTVEESSRFRCSKPEAPPNLALEAVGPPLEAAHQLRRAHE